jgi:serine-type D-Ala-D-Ala carboxypeptidase/endopeptidase
MNRLAGFLMFAIALGSAVSGRGDHAADVERLVVPLVESGSIVGCVVGVIDGDEQEVFGYGEIARGDGQTPDGATVYEIGSVTKAITGTLLADMINRGEVTLETPLAELLPEGVTARQYDDEHPLTLLHLATHTSGLPRLPHNMAPKDANNPYADYTLEMMYGFLGDYALHRAPGEYEYSNYGAALLGQLLARRAGKSYEELFVERIATPLEMNDTRIALLADMSARLAPPYDAALSPNHNWDLDAFAGAGALRSTADDMLKLLAAALDEGDSDVSRALRLAGERRHGEDGEIGVGLGWHVASDGVSRWHNGQTGGYSSFVGYIPDRRLAVVVLCNTATQLTTEMGEKVLQTLAGMTVDPPSFRQAVEVDSAVLEKYVGEYKLAPFFAITVTLEDGQLMAQATGQDKFPIFAESETEFFYRVVDAQLTFEVDADGKATKLILHQNGADVPGIRADVER